MMKRFLLVFCLLQIINSAAAQTTGMLWDDEDYNDLPATSLADKSDGVDKVSYQQFLPEVLNQGDFMTCVGFACAYYLQTAVEAKIRNLKDQAKINKIASSPVYLYQKIKSPKDHDCQSGASLSKGMAFLINQPIPSHSEFPYLQCDTYLGSYRSEKPFQIGNFYKIFEIGEAPASKVQKLKAALSSGFPVVAGISAPASFMKLKKTQWAPSKKESSTPLKHAGHAVCIVGYDNKYLGGAFLLVNSFGKSWGDKGFCWVKYQDIGVFVRYGFRIEPRLMTKNINFE